jgi:hypothetical protein
LSLTLLLWSGPWWGASASDEAGPQAPARWVVLVEGDRLTVQVDRVPLPLVLQQLARQAGLRVSGSDAAGDVVVSAAFRDVPLDEGIRRLLRAQPHVLVFAGARSGPGAPERTRISQILLVPRAKPGATDQPTGGPGLTALGDSDPRVRIGALEQWAQQREADSGDSVEPLTHALVDPDERVRARAQELWERLLATQATSTPPASLAGGGAGR